MKSKIFFFSRDRDYLEKLPEIIKNDRRKIGYVTLNKTHSYVQSVLKSEHFENEVYFLDGIARTFYSSNEDNNCEFINPENLMQFLERIVKILKNGYNLIIIDSISDLYVHHPGPSIKNMLQDLFSMNDINGEIIALCYLENKDKIQNILNLFNSSETKV